MNDGQLLVGEWMMAWYNKVGKTMYLKKRRGH